MAQRTGNAFIEMKYSNDSGETWRPSGYLLAKKQSDWWVTQVGVGEDYVWIKMKDLKFLIEEGPDYPSKSIRKGINGNSSYIRCTGVIVPLKELRAVATENPFERVVPAKKKKVSVDKTNPFA